MVSEYKEARPEYALRSQDLSPDCSIRALQTVRYGSL